MKTSNYRKMKFKDELSRCCKAALENGVVPEKAKNCELWQYKCPNCPF